MEDRKLKTRPVEDRGRPRGARGKPKRLRVFRKSKHMRRWLLQHPWSRPLLAFNYAAVLIQKIVRGIIGRKYFPNKLPAKNKKKLTNKQLDKYLATMEKYRENGRPKPSSLDGGYSCWCAVRILSWWRMIPQRRRFLYKKRIMLHIAALTIQSTWRNYRASISREKTPKYRSETLSKLSGPELIIRASYKIQMWWRASCNKRIYRFFRDLVCFKLHGAPADLLRTIVPNETNFLDRASGVHIRFRLAGAIFPPHVVFKIYTHRPLCDVNAFAPRDYAQERTPEFIEAMKKVSKKVDKTKEPQAIRVGSRYFGAKVTTNVDMNQWYKREENNEWRPLVAQAFTDILTPPWLQVQTKKAVPKPFHFSNSKRKEQNLKEKRRRKREWLVKAYMLTSGELANRSMSASEPLLAASWSAPELSMTDSIRTFQTKSSLYSDYNQPENRRSSPDISRRKSQSPPMGQRMDSKEADIRNRTRTRSRSRSRGRGDSPQNQRASSKENKGRNKKNPYDYDNDDKEQATPHIVDRDRSDGMGAEDLVDWSLALNYNDYSNDWASLATSMPSDSTFQNIYKPAVSITQNSLMGRK